MDSLIKFFGGIAKFLLGLLIVALVVTGVVLACSYGAYKSTDVTLAVDEKINNTPISVGRMRQMGEWEFLTVTDEEIVDTVRKHLFRDDELVRIYTGRLRLGIDMAEMYDDAIVSKGDSIIVTLPEVKLLDNRFIDEALTRAFYESGTWSANDYNALYAKAQRQMIERCVTAENKNTARKNGIAQIKKMLEALGLKNVAVR